MTRRAPARHGRAAIDTRAIGSVSDLHSLIATVTGPDGLEIRDHFQHLRRYRACFRGDSLVSFLAEHLCLPRPQAFAVAGRLEALEFIRHVNGVREFTDDAQLYGIGPGPRDESPSAANGSIDSLAEIVQAMRGPDGISPGMRSSALISYPNCFHGYELVRWMSLHLGVSAERAGEIGRAMLRANFIRHVFDESDFEDSNKLFLFV